MAGRRQQKPAAEESPVGNTMLIYLSLSGVIATIAACIYFFGVDFGFVQFGGTANINVLYGGAAGAILISYLADVYYIKAVKKFYQAKSSWLDFVPYFNFIGLFSKVPQMVAWGMTIISALLCIPMFTPAGQLLPTNFLLMDIVYLAIIVIIMMAIYAIMKGYHAFIFKRDAESSHRKYVSESYGSGGGIAMASYLLYFMPIVRALPLFNDVNFINSVRLELDDMRRKEEI